MTMISGRWRAISSSSSPYASTIFSGLFGAMRTGSGAEVSVTGGWPSDASFALVRATSSRVALT